MVAGQTGRLEVMSALGQKPKYAAQQTMSAIAPKADIGTQLRDVRRGLVIHCA